MQRLTSVLKVVFVNLLILLLLTLSLNFVLGKYLKSIRKSRADLPNYAYDRELANKIFYDYANVGHEYAPYSGWKILPYKGETLTIGTDGNRKSSFSEASDTNDRIKVGFFGGSTLWGEGSPDEGTIPALFSSLNSNYEVYNFGQLAFNSRQNLAVLTNLYSTGRKLDLVIFYDGVNDAAFLCPEQVSVPGHRMEPIFRERLYSNNKSLIYKALYTYLVKNVVNFTNHIRVNNFDQLAQSEYLCYKDENKINLIADGMLNNWRLAEEMVNSNDGRFIGIIQPMAYKGNPQLDHLQNLDQELGASMNMVYDRLLQDIENDSSTSVLNYSNAFDKNEYIYIDFCHVSPNGNKIIAERLTEFLRSQDTTNPVE